MQSQRISYRRKYRFSRAVGLLAMLMLLSGLTYLGRGVSYRTPGPIDCYVNTMNYPYSDRTAIHLKDCDYRFRTDIDIPGMPSTGKKDLRRKIVYSIEQVPQGICIARDYLLVTSYSTKKDRRGVLLVLDWKTGEHLTTLGMNEKSHLGGVAFDGTNVWVCNSANRTLERISFDFIELMALQNRGKVVDAKKMVDEFRVEDSPSCVACYGGRLWVATHTKFFSSGVAAYHLDSSGKKLLRLSQYRIPSKVQGMVFGPGGEVYLSTSYGRTFSSYLKKYRSLVAMSTSPQRPEVEIEMPPCSEDIEQRDGRVYVIFESAAKKYYEGTDGLGVSISPIDRILELRGLP